MSVKNWIYERKQYISELMCDSIYDDVILKVVTPGVKTRSSFLQTKFHADSLVVSM